jgi:hypothetical protein
VLALQGFHQLVDLPIRRHRRSPHRSLKRIALRAAGGERRPTPRLARKALTRLGQTRCNLSLAAIDAVLEQTAEVLTALAPSVTKYFKERAAHPEIGDRLVAAWQTGIGDSLGFAGRGR